MLRYIFYWFLLFFIYRFFVLVFAGAQGTTAGGVLIALLADGAWAGLCAVIFAALFRLRLRPAAHTIYGLLILFLIVAFGFARLYERPFSLHFVRMDTGTIWKENFISGLYELGLPHLALASVAMLHYWFFLRKAPEIRYRDTLVGFISVTLLAAQAFTAAPVPVLAANPLSAFITPRPPVQKMEQLQIGRHELIPTLVSPDLLPALPAVSVRRPAGRSVILYYLESTPFSVIGKKINGREVTPHLNRLSERSLFFTRHYANFPLSINAFYNSFCSAYALPDGAWISLALPDFPVPCLSQILAGEGYRAAALHAGYLGYAKQKRFLLGRGFNLLIDAETLKKPPYEKGMGPWGAADERAMIRPLVEFVQKDKNPFVALLFAFAPHHPYNMPDDFPAVFSGEKDMKKSQVRYFNSLHFADAAFGEILTALEKNGTLRDTILVVFGDHGEAFYEHPGNYNHPFFLYEENVHVPLMIYYEGVVPQKVIRVTSHVDILPTVLDLLGKEHLLSPMHVGKSMLRGGAQSVAHLQAYWQEEFSGIVDARYKFIRRETGAEELFDLSTDRSEKQNILMQMPDTAQQYRLMVAKAFAQKKAYYEIYGSYKLTRFNPASQDK